MSSTDSTNDSMFAALEAELDVEMIDWEPEQAGERIVGVIKSIEYVPINAGGMMGVLTLTTPSGALARVAAGAKNLKSQLESLKVQPGDGLALMYEGEKTPRKGGRNYNAYRVAVQGIGERRPDDVFKVPAASDDLGFVEGVTTADDPWTSQETGA